MPISLFWGCDMAIYQDVSPGEKVVNSAQRYNDINRLLNAAQGMNEGFPAGRDFSKTKVKSIFLSDNVPV